MTTVMRKTLGILFLALATLAGEVHAKASAVVSIGMTVSDLDRSIDWYTRVLTFEKAYEPTVHADARVAQLRLGSETIELSQPLDSTGRPIPADSRSNDRWFQHIAIIVSDMDSAYARLQRYEVVAASVAPQTLPGWNKNAAGIRAFYFKDPDNHVLEILQFPPDKGEARWHAQSDRLFLGIDHTAIVVSDTEASLAFYRDLLGFTVSGRGENYGIEQERLNNVKGAHLRITTLRPVAGPAVEFLQYLAPNDGRPYPTDSRAGDLWNWQTTIHTSAAGEFAASNGSRNAAKLVETRTETSTGILVRDPDGHAIRLVQR